MPPRDVHLQGARNERVVRRPISAKRSDAHQPEGPSVAGRSRANGEESHQTDELPVDRFQRLFHHR